MLFSEIKDKIRNLGQFRTLKQIKDAGLRIAKNTVTGDYWLIEDEFLKPVIKSPRECKSILVKPENLKYKIFMCHKDKKELKGANALKYIEWGEGQGFHNRPSCKSRKKWWDLGERKKPEYIFPCGIGDIFRVFKNESVLADKRLYEIYSDNQELHASLNSIVFFLFLEVNSRKGLGDGLLDLTVYEVAKSFIMGISDISENTKSELIKASAELFKRTIGSIFSELGMTLARPIREQAPAPLPDRKALDDIVFDILGLTQDERNEVYWAVCELVKNRLDKAKSM